jgi:two-component system, NtrC family, response regulator HydG
MARILIIDDNETMREGLGATVRRMGHEALLAASGDEGLKQVAAGRNTIDFVITDLKMEGTGGLEVLKAVAERDPDCPVMIATAFGSVETAVEAMRTGAYDFIQKPFAPEVVRLKVARALELRAERRARERAEAESAALRDDVAREYRFAEIVGETPAMRALFQTIEKVAPTDASVYIHGESGTGKELVARAIHDASSRRERLLVKVNCAAISAGLVESELFGHEKGAFTGAVQRRKGRFELAHGGTLFLDEVGELPPETQVKLLRVLQEREFERVGGSETVRVDVRLIAATNRNLREMVARGRFREDLYYRLAVFPVALPPLRDRVADIPLLVRSFLLRFARQAGRPIHDVTPEAMDELVSYRWPGNVRELQNVIERSVILARGPLVDLDALPDLSDGGMHSFSDDISSAQTPPPVIPLRTPAPTIDELERGYVAEVLAETSWVIEGERGAARRLGLHPNTLRSRLKRWGLTRPIDQLGRSA